MGYHVTFQEVFDWHWTGLGLQTDWDLLSVYETLVKRDFV